MRKIKYLLATLLSLTTTLTQAQDGTKQTVGKFMYSNERSYVVIAVILLILLGIVLYLVRLERKIKKLEKS